MLVVFMCIMMKILDVTVGPVKPKVRNHRRPPRRLLRGLQAGLPLRGMPEDISASPDSTADLNSNHTTTLEPGKHGDISRSFASNTSSQDLDFVQDNSDYQWFLDYGYRDGSTSTSQPSHHISVLSCCNDVDADYEDMARNIDANLAEVDMEDFRTEDIHSILSTLPTMCCGDLQSEHHGEMFASVSGSLMAKFEFDSSISPHSSSQAEDDTVGSTDTMSICKSEQLFSPVRECPLPSCNFSVDSLDCEGLTEHDIMLTCQANKDNYTIAFEGSLALCSETDSDYHEPGESDVGTSTESHHRWRHRHISRPSLDTSMARSDSVYTTWSKLKKRSSDVTLSRHPSGNNNTTPKVPTTPAALKSRSLPDLCPGKCVRLYDMGNLSLLRLFMRQRGSCSQSDSAGGGSSQGSSHRHCSLDDCSTCATTTNNNYNNRLSGSDNGNTTTGTTVRQQRLDNWIRADDTTEDYSTCCFEDSLVEPPQKELMQGYQPELIQEETEEETSESVEQLSESVSKIEESIVLDTSGSSCYGSKMRLARFNLNNNNSVEEPKPSQGTQTNCPVNRSIGILASPILSTKSVQTAAERRRCYLLFPNYTLPDLAFLGDKRRDIELLLAPQKLKARHGIARRPRPLSCDDVEALRRKGFAHVKDRDSLAVLLPKEYRQLLEPETKISTSTASSTNTQPSSGFRGSSTLLTDSNPLLVYRYDSETSSCHQPALPKRSVSLPNGAPPRPPLPRSILRRGHEAVHGHRKPPPTCLDPDKERDECEDDDEGVDAGTDSSYEEPISRMRPPTPPLPRKQDDCELLRLEELLHVSGLSSVLTSGEGVDTWDEADMKRLRQQVSKFLAGQRSESQNTPHNTPEHRLCDCSSSGRSSRKTVSFRLSLPTPPNSPSNNVHHQSKMANEGIGTEKEHISSGRSNQSSEKKLSPVLCQNTPSPLTHIPSVDMSQKRELVTAVGDAVEQVVSHFAAAENRQHCCLLGDSVHTPAIARLTLGKLCPALYAALSDGLKSELDTAFGPIPNSLWQVVEASAQQGPMTKALNELVLRINSEDVFTEGLMKFNAFVFGLLNVRSLDAWAGYLRTRESVLKRHYHEDSGLLPLGNLGGPGWRGLADQLVACLQPLALLPFRLDILYQPRQLAARLTLSPPAQQQQKQWSLRGLVRSIHSSLSVSTSEDSKDSPLPDIVGSSKVWENERTPRPRSCVDTPAVPGNAPGSSLVTDLASTVRKRWSGIQLGSKLFQAFDRLAAEDEGCSLGEYPDSLEQQAANAVGGAAEQSPGSTGQAGGKFRRLQMKWELLSNKEPPSNGPSPKSSPDSNFSSVSSNTGKSSRIPRPVTSPSRASGIPVLSPGVPRSTGTISRRSASAIPMRKQSPAPVRSNVSSDKTRKVPVGTTSRPSRLDQVDSKSSANRPSSLPYRQPSGATGRATQRRPVSASGTGVRTAPTAQRRQHSCVYKGTH